jgi:hypothetical protein
MMPLRLLVEERRVGRTATLAQLTAAYRCQGAAAERRPPVCCSPRISIWVPWPTKMPTRRSTGARKGLDSSSCPYRFCPVSQWRPRIRRAEL